LLWSLQKENQQIQTHLLQYRNILERFGCHRRRHIHMNTNAATSSTAVVAAAAGAAGAAIGIELLSLLLLLVVLFVCTV